VYCPCHADILTWAEQQDVNPRRRAINSLDPANLAKGIEDLGRRELCAVEPLIVGAAV
jgi:hypothetical protein